MKIINKVGLIKIKNFCSSEDSVKRRKMKSTEGEKYLQTMCMLEIQVQNILLKPLKFNKEKINT